MNASLSNSIDFWAQQWSAIHDTGLGICVRDNEGKIVFNKAFGLHNKSSEDPMQNNAIYPIGSQTKTLTAVAILQLVNEGNLHPATGRPLDLDDCLTHLLPHLKNTAWLDGVTLKDVLCHRTRFGRGLYNKEWGTQKLSFDNLRNIRMSDIIPDSAPGYSNRAYNMLGLVIEDASGMKFGDYMRTEIVERHNLGEIYSDYDEVPDEKLPYIPKGYAGDKLDEPVTLKSSGGTTPAGGFFATTEAINGFYHKLANGLILPGTRVDQVTATGMFVPLNKGSGWAGMGMMIASLEQHDNFGNDNPYYLPGRNGKIYGHEGSMDKGYQGHTRHDPHNGYTITVMNTGFDCDFPHSRQTAEMMASVLKIVSDTAPALDHKISPKRGISGEGPPYMPNHYTRLRTPETRHREKGASERSNSELILTGNAAPIVNLVVDVEMGTLLPGKRTDGTIIGLNTEARENYIQLVADAVSALSDQGIPTLWIRFPYHAPRTPEQIRDEHLLDRAIGRKGGKTVFFKTGFDAFADGRNMNGDTLHSYLQLTGTRRLTIMGGNADVCDLATAIGAARKGYEVTILSDLIIGRNNLDGDTSVSEAQIRETLHNILSTPDAFKESHHPLRKEYLELDADGRRAIDENLKVQLLSEFMETVFLGPDRPKTSTTPGLLPRAKPAGTGS